jgi:hypothetical protein
MIINFIFNLVISKWVPQLKLLLARMPQHPIVQSS